MCKEEETRTVGRATGREKSREQERVRDRRRPQKNHKDGAETSFSLYFFIHRIKKKKK